MSWLDTIADTITRAICSSPLISSVTDYIGGPSSMKITIVNKLNNEIIIYTTPAMPARKWISISNSLSDAGFEQEGDDTIGIVLDGDDGKMEDLCRLVEEVAKGASRATVKQSEAGGNEKPGSKLTSKEK